MFRGVWGACPHRKFFKSCVKMQLAALFEKMTALIKITDFLDLKKWRG